jgi:Cdc6-like AAA superfamily ATPase
MINTKLILLEGLPGSGKTTIAKKIFERITYDNKYLVQEFFNPHPINEEGIKDIKLWTIKTLENWRKLSNKIISERPLYVIEYALLQNTISEMLEKDSALPVLILFTADNTETFLRETYSRRSDGWKMKITNLIDGTDYGKNNNLKGLNGYLAFSNDFVKIRDEIIKTLDINSISIDVTERKWDSIEEQVYNFLKI